MTINFMTFSYDVDFSYEIVSQNLCEATFLQLSMTHNEAISFCKKEYSNNNRFKKTIEMWIFQQVLTKAHDMYTTSLWLHCI